MAKVNIKPKIGEITTETNFLDSIGSLPNPDLILRNAGIAEDTYIEMMYDAQIFTAYQKRKRKIQRYNYELSGGSAKVNEFILNILENIINFEKVQSGMLKALPFGYAILEIIWEDVEGKFIPTDIKPRINTKFSFNFKSELLYKDEFGQLQIAPDYKFIVHRNDNDDDSNPYGTSLNSRAYWFWRFKKHGWRLWGTFLEKYGDPALVFKTSENKPEILEDMQSSLDNVSSGSNIIIGLEDSITSLNVNANNANYIDYTAEADKQIAKIYLGSPELIEASSSGNYSSADNMSDSLDDITLSDVQAMAKTLKIALLKPIILFNFGEKEEVPNIVFYKETTQEGTQGAENDTDTTKDTNKKTTDTASTNTSKNITDNIEDDVEFFRSSEAYSQLPDNIKYVEDTVYELAKSQKKSLEKILNLDNFSDDIDSAYKELGQKYFAHTQKMSINLSYALFDIYLYSKLMLKENSNFDMFKIEATAISDFETARKKFQSKITITDEEFRRLTNEAKSEAFKIATIQTKKMTNLLKHSLEEAMLKKSSEYEWKKVATNLLSKNGLSLSKNHLATIYRTNLFSAYSKANYAEWETVAEDFPAFMYDAVGDGRTRPAHNALDGKIFLATDSIWSRIYPPNGYNCRCTVRPISVSKLKNIKVDDGKDYMGAKYAPDAGWDYHSGKGNRKALLSNLLNDGENIKSYKDLNLGEKPIVLEDVAFKEKPITLKTDLEVDEILGGSGMIPKGDYTQLEILQDVLNSPSEVWLFERKTNSNKIGYVIKYLKNYRNLGNILVTLDANGSLLEFKKTFSNLHRRGYLMHEATER